MIRATNVMGKEVMKRASIRKVLLTYLMYLVVALVVASSVFIACEAYYPLVLLNFLCVSVAFLFAFMFKDKIQERPIWSLLFMELLFLLICFGTVTILITTVDIPAAPRGNAISSSAGLVSSQKNERLVGEYGD